ncbi:MAG: transglycosylase SLT domain-containing protein [Alistipes sp.]
MLKKVVLTFVFITILTTFYGFNANFAGSSSDDARFEKMSNEHSLLPAGNYLISAYDNIFRNVSEKEGHDWRLMSAIAYHESRFTPNIVSRQGARGLMQIMPAVARQFNISREQIVNPETNVWIANQLMSKITKALQIPVGTSEMDRMSLVLASYNGGIGHVNDARRLATLHGENPNSWETVSRYLQLKADSAYYENEVVKCGKFTGSRQTIAYVDDVIGRYNKYCRMAKR